MPSGLIFPHTKLEVRGAPGIVALHCTAPFAAESEYTVLFSVATITWDPTITGCPYRLPLSTGEVHAAAGVARPGSLGSLPCRGLSPWNVGKSAAETPAGRSASSAKHTTDFRNAFTDQADVGSPPCLRKVKSAPSVPRSRWLKSILESLAAALIVGLHGARAGRERFPSR